MATGPERTAGRAKVGARQVRRLRRRPVRISVDLCIAARGGASGAATRGGHWNQQVADVFFLGDDPRLDPRSFMPTRTVTYRGEPSAAAGTGLLPRPSPQGSPPCPVGQIASLRVGQTWASTYGCSTRNRSRLSGRRCVSDSHWRVTPVRTTVGRLLPGARRDGGARQLELLLGPLLSACLADGLARLVADFPQRHLPQAQVTGPTLEGVGMYLDHDDRLATRLPGLWVAGDAAGSFRGLTAAMVSGHAAGAAALAAPR